MLQRTRAALEAALRFYHTFQERSGLAKHVHYDTYVSCYNHIFHL
jgi:hypothetical protein